MSDLNLATSNQYEVNAKNPNVAAAVDDSFFNIKLGKRYNNELDNHSVGFVAKGIGLRDMGRVSDNAVIVGESLDLWFFQVREDDFVHFNLSDTQLTGVTAIKVVMQSFSSDLEWDAIYSAYTATITDGYAHASALVGATVPIYVTDTTP